MSEKFLHTLTPEKNNYLWVEYRICDVLWCGHALDTWDYLSCQPRDNTILKIRAASAESEFTWEYSYRIAEGVYCSSSGSAPNIEQACIDVLSYSPKIITLDYLCQNIAWYGSEEKSTGRVDWKACIDGCMAEAVGPFKYDDEPEYFEWKRYWPKANSVLKFVGKFYGRCLEGRASTLREACIAAVVAPEEFTMACGAFVATLKQGFHDPANDNGSNDD